MEEMRKNLFYFTVCRGGDETSTTAAAGKAKNDCSGERRNVRQRHDCLHHYDVDYDYASTTLATNS